MEQKIANSHSKLHAKERLKNTVEICINIYGSQYSRELLLECFLNFCFFKPYRMSVFSGTRGGTKKYNEEVFNNAILNEKNNYIGLEDREYHNMINVYADKSSMYCNIKLPMHVWNKDKESIIEKYESLFVRMGGCFGFVVNAFDDCVIQNPNNAKEYKLYEVDDTDFAGINSIPIISSNIPCCSDKIDKSYLPGTRVTYDRMSFTTAPYMWFGPDFYRFYSQKKIEEYNECCENIEIAPSFRRIILWENVREYNNQIYRKRQWFFRKKTKLDDIGKMKFIPKDEKSLVDPTMEFKRGEFEHGGELLAKFYIDKKGCSCNKSFADFCVYREMKGNTIVWQEKKKLL